MSTERVPINLLYQPDSNPFRHTDDAIARRAADIDPLNPPIIIVAKDKDGKLPIIDGVLNFYSCKLKGMHQAEIQVIDIESIDYGYEAIKRNKHKKLTHEMIAMLIPIMVEWWERKNPDDDKDRKRKFISITLEDMGTQYSERNVQKLLDIIQYAPHLLKSMDNNDRIVDRFHKLAEIQAKKRKAKGPGEPAAPLTEDNDVDDGNCDEKCEPKKNAKPTGIMVKIAVGDTVKELDSSYFCTHCVVNRITFEAVNPILPPDDGTFPDEDDTDAKEEGGES